jgi:hypothetical protein
MFITFRFKFLLRISIGNWYCLYILQWTSYKEFCRMKSISRYSLFPFLHFLLMVSSVGLNDDSDLTFSKNSVKITVGCHLLF